MTTASPPPLTVGDLNARSNLPRAVMWVAAVCMVIASVAAYCIYHNMGSAFPVLATAYWLPPLMLWGVYLGVVQGLVIYMHLFLPEAPLTVREALMDVGMGWVGLPLAWMAVALTCVMVILLAGLVAFGVRLHRTYSSS